MENKVLHFIWTIKSWMNESRSALFLFEKEHYKLQLLLCSFFNCRFGCFFFSFQNEFQKQVNAIENGATLDSMKPVEVPAPYKPEGLVKVRHTHHILLCIHLFV